MMLDKKLYEAFEMMAKEQEIQLNEKELNSAFAISEDSDRFKRKMNRLFRERLGAKNDIPYPAVDKPYEYVRSRIIRFFLVTAELIRKAIGR